MAKNTHYIKYLYSNIPTSKKHFFEVRVMFGKSRVAGKNFSIGEKRNIDQAFNDMAEAGIDLAKKYKITEGITPPPKAALITATKAKRSPSSLTQSSASKPASTAESHANQFMERFGVEGRFRAMIKKAISLYGVEKIADALNAGLDEIKSAQEELQKEMSIRLAANTKIAEAILAARDEGVDMESPSAEVTELIQMAISKRERNASGRGLGKTTGVLYRLNGEEWDGVGHAPASFAKYISEGEARSIDDLRVFKF